MPQKNNQSPLQTISQALEFLYSLNRFGIKPGLERTEELAQAVGNPHLSLQIIHVAGTNGKGSTSSMIASILQESGYRVGLYTSPHIIHFNERIRINGIQIPNEVVLEYCQELYPHILSIGATYFESVTVMALMYYARNSVDCAIIETGMGGRLDATNICNPLCSIITSIDYDHQEYLGNTLSEIAGEKAGIIKEGVPVIIGEPRKELASLFYRHAQTVDAPIFFIDDSIDSTIISWNSNRTMTIRHSKILHGTSVDYVLDVVGEHQLRNSSMCLLAIEILQDFFPHCTPEMCLKGLRKIKHNTKLFGRIHYLVDTPPIVLDVGHNNACLSQLVKTIGHSHKHIDKWNIVFGVMEDKDYRQMLTILAPIINLLLVGTPDNPRALPSDAIYEIARSMDINAINSFTIENGIQIAYKTHEPMLIVGSFYVAEEAVKTLQSLGIQIDI